MKFGMESESYRNDKDHSIDDLQKSLNINIVQQEELEKLLNSKLNTQITKNEDELDQKRLEKAGNVRKNVVAKIESLQKRSENPYTKISEKQYILRQIKDLKEKNLSQIESDIKEIKGRIASRRVKLKESESSSKMDGKLPNETTQEYLIRTGRITAFGTSNTFSFQAENDNEAHSSRNVQTDSASVQTPKENKQARKSVDISSKGYEDTEIDEVDNKEDFYPDESDEYFPDEAEDDKDNDSDFQLSDVDVKSMKQSRKRKISSKSSAQNLSEVEQDELLEELEDLEDASEEEVLVEDQDDGDEYLYKVRLASWLKERECLRDSESSLSNTNNESKEWFRKLPKVKDAMLNDGFKVPGEIFSKLFDYQKTCVQWLWELNCQKVGGIIGDEMGLGKTIQMISFLAALHYSKKISKPILIVCPSTVMKQWCNEFHNWWPSFRVSILHSIGSGMQNNTAKKKKVQDIDDELYELIEDDDQDNKVKRELSSKKMKSKAEYLVHEIFKNANEDKEAPGQVIITTYSGLKIYSNLLLNNIWSYVVLDEGHKIRNPNAGVSLAAKQLRTHNRIILSGTPIQNNLTELWSLFDFIYPGKLGTLPIFQNNFIIPINMGGYSNASNIQVQTSLKVAIALKDLISPYLLRRLKTDVAKDLPKKTELVLFCKLTNFQLNKYLEFLKSSVAESILSGKRHALYGIDILKKICNHPDLLKINTKYLDSLKTGSTKNHKDTDYGHSEDEDYGPNSSSNYAVVNSKNFGNPILSGKMLVLKTLLLLWKSEGHKILLFTQTRQMLNILEKFVSSHLASSDNKFNYLRMDGTTPIKNRQILMNDFNNKPYIHLFLLTTRVGGLGVNLIGANRVIIFDPDWNPSTDIQARERAWRLGQTKDVVIYRLMTKGTIEEKIYQRQIYKQFLSNKVLKDPNQKRVFKMNQLNDLFTYGNDDDDDDDDSVYYRNPKFNRAVIQKSNKKNDTDDDFEKMAKISGVAKLEKFNNGDGSIENEKNANSSKLRKIPQKDEDRVLSSLLENSGISANIEDDAIDGLGKHERDSIINKEANKIADQAIRALKESKKLAREKHIGVPTWTGKFGSAGKIQKKSAIRNTTKGKNIFSSKSIIEKHKANMEGKDTSKNLLSSSTSAESSKVSSEEPSNFDKQIFNNDLLKDRKDIAHKFQQYLNSREDFFATSKQLIARLNVRDDLSDSDIKLIRSILKKIAMWNKQKRGWVLNPDFRD